MSGLFLNPWLWPFLAAASLPIILHLLSLRRLPVVELSTFRFLFDTYVQQRRRLRLLEYLLLFLRVLFLLLLVLALMRPTQTNWSSLFGIGESRSAYIVVDCSVSMNAQTAGVSSLERAKEAAAAVVDNLSASDRVTLIRLVQQPEAVLDRFAADSPELKTAIANLRPSIASANVHAGLSTVLGEERRGGRSVYFVTDLQRTGWKQILDQPGGLSFGDDKVFVVNVGGDRRANSAVVGDAPTESDAIVGQPVELRPRVGNFSDRPVDATLVVEVDGRQIARFSLNVPPGKTTTRKVVYVPMKAGPIRGSYRIDRDPFDADDEYQFVLNVAKPVRVLVVNGNPHADPFKDELLFLRAALRSRFTADDDPALTEGGGLRTLDAQSLTIEEVREGEWNADRLQGLDLVILANAQQFNEETTRALKQFVRSGGGLLLFPGDRVTGRWRELFESNFRGDTPLLPLKLGEAVGDDNRRDRFERFAAVDYGNPIFSVFRPAEGKEYLTTPRFFRRHRLQLNPGDRRSFTLAQFANREPAIVQGEFGRGTVVICAFPVSGEWSTLPLVGADFVPMMLRMVSHVRQRPELRAPSAIVPGADAVIAVADRLEDPTCTATGPDGGKRSISMSRGSADWVGKIDAAERGVQMVELSAREPTPVREERSDARPPEDRRVSAEAGFAVNLAERESDFTRLTADELRTAVGPQASLVDLSATSAGVAKALTERREFWRWLMYALAAVFVVEFFLATLRGPRTAAEAALDAEQGDWTARLTGVREMTKGE